MFKLAEPFTSALSADFMVRVSGIAFSEAHAKLIWAGVKPGTRDLYDTSIRLYLKVCKVHNITQPFLVIVATLSIFITALVFGESSIRRIKYTIITKYLIDVCSWYMDLNMPTEVFGNNYVRFLL